MFDEMNFKIEQPFFHTTEYMEETGSRKRKCMSTFKEGKTSMCVSQYETGFCPLQNEREGDRGCWAGAPFTHCSQDILDRLNLVNTGVLIYSDEKL